MLQQTFTKAGAYLQMRTVELLLNEGVEPTLEVAQVTERQEDRQ